MSPTTNQPGSTGGKKSVPKPKAALADELKEQLGMKRWLRVTARKSLSTPKAAGHSGNPAADAAAQAIAEMLKEAKKLA